MANEFLRTRVAKATYSFAVDGGAVSTITPVTTEIIPNGAIITDVKVNVRTTVTTSAAAEIALTAGGVTIKAAETIANSVYNGTGIVNVIRAGNAGATGTAKYIPIIATSDASVKVVISVGAVTAGVFDIYVEYID